MASFIPFDVFRRLVESSRFEDHVEAIKRALARKARVAGHPVPGPGDPVADPLREFERMREYLIAHYWNTSVAHSFVDEGGRIVDCIPFDQQPTVQAARRMGIEVVRTAPPPSPRDRPVGKAIDEKLRVEPVVPPLARGLEDADGNPRSAPPGTVPVRRITLERLASHGRLDDFFTKGPPCRQIIDPRAATTGIGGPSPFTPQPGPDGYIHLHAGVQCPPAAPGAYSGVSSFLSVWKPDVSPGSMSLAQQWILSREPAPNGNPSTVEGGWQVLSNVDMEPELFVFFNPDGYGPESGYVNNRSSRGFIIYEGAQWAPGGAIGRVSSIDGAQVGFVMEWVLDDSGWILYMGSDAASRAGVGYFPREYYAGGLANGAGYLQFGGEVANAGPSSLSTGQMGSGSLPIDPLDSSYQRVAFQYDLSSRRLGETTLSPVVAGELSLIGEAPDCYLAAPASHEAWGTHFWFGGAKAP